MKIYKVNDGIIIEKEGSFFSVHEEDWDNFVNADNLYLKTATLTEKLSPSIEGDKILRQPVLAPVGKQEVWASGVTYLRSKVERENESRVSKGSDFYSRVYEAERPELFFKSTADRVVGPEGKVSIRKDSTWNVPEPELTLLISSNGKIIGYTIGNDMSSRSIEGENPLYLPQAKVYDGSAAIGPCIYVIEGSLPLDLSIHMQIIRENNILYDDQTNTSRIKRDFNELVSYLYRELSFRYGCFLMTGTGLVPPNDFTLRSNDIIKISIEGIGTLTNTVK